MTKTRLDNKFFESTRGRIVLQLRNGRKTVNELAASLNLTDNAIRANLLTLERDRLIEQTGSIKGFRKPHYSYGLTSEARHLFPKAYDLLFNGLVSELKSRLRPAALIDTLRTIGRRVAGERKQNGTATLDEKVDQTLAALEELGGSAHVLRNNGHVVIKSESCPFAEAVSEHPEVCQVAEAMIEEIVGAPVKEVCDRTGSPKCCFEISAQRSGAD